MTINLVNLRWAVAKISLVYSTKILLGIKKEKKCMFVLQGKNNRMQLSVRRPKNILRGMPWDAHQSIKNVTYEKEINQIRR